MKKIITVLLIFAAALMTGCSSEAKEDTYRVLKVDISEGNVIVERTDEALEAFSGMNLASNDYISVQENSSIVLLADSDKHIAAEENTEFRITSTGTKDNGNITIELIKGQSLFTIDEKLSENSSFVVKTPNAVLSVRGTTFTVCYDNENDSTYLDVEQGVVYTETADNTMTEEVTIGEKRIIKSDSIKVTDSLPIVIRSEKNTQESETEVTTSETMISTDEETTMDTSVCETISVTTSTPGISTGSTWQTAAAAANAPTTVSTNVTTSIVTSEETTETTTTTVTTTEETTETTTTTVTTTEETTETTTTTMTTAKKPTGSATAPVTTPQETTEPTTVTVPATEETTEVITTTAPTTTQATTPYTTTAEIFSSFSTHVGGDTSPSFSLGESYLFVCT